MHAPRSLRWRLPLAWLAGGVCLLGLAGGVLYLEVRELLLRQAAFDLIERHRRLGEELSSLLATAERGADALAAQVASGGLDASRLAALMQARLLQDGELVQVGVMLEAENPLRKDGRVGLVVTYTSQGLQVTDFLQNGYRYWEQEWYRQTLASREGWWSEVYFNDAAGGLDTITYDLPLLGAEGVATGLVGVSLSIDRLQELAAETAAGPDGKQQYALVDASGRILLAWTRRLERAYSVDAAIRIESAALLELLAGAPQQDAPRLLRAEDARRGGQWLVEGAIPKLGWRLVLAQDDRATLAPLHERLGAMAPWAALLLGALTAWAVRRGGAQARQLEALSRRAADFHQAPSQGPPPRLYGREIEALLEAIDGLGSALQESREALSRQDAAAREMGAQVDLARSLQTALLPSDQLLFGRSLCVELAGWLQPAVAAPAGHGYSFFASGPGRCGFYLLQPEVEGAAALLAALQLGALLPPLIRDTADPAEALKRAAEAWRDGGRSPPCRVRLLVGQLDLNDGALRLAAAGPMTPLLRRADGSPRPLALAEGPALPDRDDSDGSATTLVLAPGDLLLASSQAPAGVDLLALQVALERHAELPPPALLAALADELGWREDRGEHSALAIRLKHRD